MIKITNSVDTYEITKGAFPQFASQGYRIIEDNGVKVGNAKQSAKKVKEAQEDFAESDDSAESDEIEVIAEKPIAQWSKDEVKAYAEAKGIDIHGTKNVNEAKEIIKKYL